MQSPEGIFKRHEKRKGVIRHARTREDMTRHGGRDMRAGHEKTRWRVRFMSAPGTDFSRGAPACTRFRHHGSAESGRSRASRAPISVHGFSRCNSPCRRPHFHAGTTSLVSLYPGVPWPASRPKTGGDKEIATVKSDAHRGENAAGKKQRHRNGDGKPFPSALDRRRRRRPVTFSRPRSATVRYARGYRGPPISP